MRNYKIYLQDIFDAIKSIEDFIKNMDFEEFKFDDKTSSAVVRKLEIIGEATKNIPENIRKQHPQIPWKEMAGMRDRLIHFYFGIDYKLVWKTIKERIPEIKPLIRKLIKE
jgi:uncharacterized protein with HEPN domain